jgi:hypothetical protein
LSFAGVVAATVAVATARCAWVATITEYQPELNNLIATENRFYLEKISNEQIDDDCSIV